MTLTVTSVYFQNVIFDCRTAVVMGRIPTDLEGVRVNPALRGGPKRRAGHVGQSEECNVV
jgi:hypothetical protein